MKKVAFEIVVELVHTTSICMRVHITMRRYMILTLILYLKVKSQEIYQTMTQNKSFTLPFKPQMSKDKWVALSPQEQQAWDSLSNKSKAVILGIITPKSASGLNESHNKSYDSPTINAHNTNGCIFG